MHVSVFSEGTSSSWPWETCTSHCPVWMTNRKLYIDTKKTSESVVHIFYTLRYMCSILCQNFTLLPIILSEIWIIIYDFWSSPDDRQTTDDRQKAMHMSPPCNLHRRAQKVRPYHGLIERSWPFLVISSCKFICKGFLSSTRSLPFNGTPYYLVMPYILQTYQSSIIQNTNTLQTPVITNHQWINLGNQMVV